MGVHYYAVYKTPIGTIGMHVPRVMASNSTDPTSSFLEAMLEIDSILIDIERLGQTEASFQDWVFAQLHPKLDSDNAVRLKDATLQDIYFMYIGIRLLDNFVRDDYNAMPVYYVNEAFKAYFDKVYADIDENMPEFDLEIF